MQHYLVKPSARLEGRLRVPGDKSISHRALVIGAVARGGSEINGFLHGEDCLATMAALRAMGVRITVRGERVTLEGVGLHGLTRPQAPLDLGNSGTAMRLLAGLLAGQPFDSELRGDASLMRRPMQRVAEPLNRMGARIVTDQERPPIRITGGARLTGIDYRLPVPSAQVKSALLLAALYASGPTVVRGAGASRDHTERMLAAMGVALEWEEDLVRLTPGAEPRALGRVTIPGDFSSAAFLLLGGALAAQDELVIHDVGINPTRTGLLNILQRMGARIQVTNRRFQGREPIADLHVHRSQLRGTDVPPELVPLAIDEFPVVFVAAAAAHGATRIGGAEELRYKESDRIGVMLQGLRALGVRVEEHADGAVIHGGGILGGEVDSAGDHRVAMAFAMAGLAAVHPICIRDTANVATSFPDFPALVRRAGLDLEVQAA